MAVVLWRCSIGRDNHHRQVRVNACRCDYRCQPGKPRRGGMVADETGWGGAARAGECAVQDAFGPGFMAFSEK